MEQTITSSETDAVEINDELTEIPETVIIAFETVHQLIAALVEKGKEQETLVQKKKKRKYNLVKDHTIIPRRFYSLDEREMIIKIFKLFKVDYEAVNLIQSIPTFEKVDLNMIRRWIRKTTPNKKCGKPVNAEFEKEILIKCITEISKTPECAVDDLTAQSYSIIRKCALETVEEETKDEVGNTVPRWRDKKGCRHLKFTSKWIHGFLKRVKDIYTQDDSLGIQSSSGIFKERFSVLKHNTTTTTNLNNPNSDFSMESLEANATIDSLSSSSNFVFNRNGLYDLIAAANMPLYEDGVLESDDDSDDDDD